MTAEYRVTFTEADGDDRRIDVDLDGDAPADECAAFEMALDLAVAHVTESHFDRWSHDRVGACVRVMIERMPVPS